MKGERETKADKGRHSQQYWETNEGSQGRHSRIGRQMKKTREVGDK